VPEEQLLVELIPMAEEEVCSLSILQETREEGKNDG